MRKSFDDLTIADDFMFCAVMQDKSICTAVLNMVLADSIGPISDITYQKTFDQAGYAKSIRLDVWVTGSNGSVYDVVNRYHKSADLKTRKIKEGKIWSSTIKNLRNRHCYCQMR